MTEPADTAELARLDEVIAKNDAGDGANARWRAAYAVYEKAELIERMDGADAALALYADVIQRLEGCREPGPRELLIVAMNDVAVIHHKHGRHAQSRSAAEALVRAHFDDAPPEATVAVVNGTLLLAKILGEAGEYEQALELFERVIERYGHPGAPNHQRTVAVANSEAAWVLGEAGRLDEGIRRCDAVIRGLGDPVDVALRSVLLDALVKQANLLTDNDRPEDRNAVCEEIVERFAGSEDAEIAENVTWAQMMLDADAAEAWWARGCRLHRRVGRAAEAETAYRKAIEGGCFDAWLNLGILLSAVPGRQADEESALRMAMVSEDPQIASLAALKLGNVLDCLQGDLAGARTCFELAIAYGSGVTAQHATIGLGMLAAYEGDPGAARDALRAATIARGDSCGVDMRASAHRMATVFATVASAWPTRRLWRRYLQAVYRTRRRFRALRMSSLPARRLARARPP